MVADTAQKEARRNAIFEEIRARIIGFLLKHGVPKTDAEDIGNATLVVLLEKPDVPIDPPPMGLAIAIAKNKLHEHYRRGPTYSHPPEDRVADDGDSPLDVLVALADREEKIKALEAALEQLGSPCREITRWKMKGMRAIDIAREMKTNVNAVEVQAHRCVGRIRILLAEQKRRLRN